MSTLKNLYNFKVILIALIYNVLQFNSLQISLQKIFFVGCCLNIKVISTLHYDSNKLQKAGFYKQQPVYKSIFSFCIFLFEKGIQQRLKQATNARAQEIAGGKVLYAYMNDEQITALPSEMYRQGYEYYRRTHVHPNSTFKYTMSSLLDLMRWDATDQIELINQPLLMKGDVCTLFS